MVLINLLFSVFTADASVSCKTFLCYPEDLGNGQCQLYCNNPYCNYDASLTRTFGLSPIQTFLKSDCYKKCIASGCVESNLGNSICDKSCNNIYCAWDLSDCGVCSSGCTSELLENHRCDKQCNSDYCNKDNEYCKTMCGTSCTKQLLEDPVCQPQCGNLYCFTLYPNSSCFSECAKGCYTYLKGNGICNAECNNIDCSYDLGDCDCNPGCNDGNLYDENCNENDPCDHENCNFKLGSCGDCNSKCFNFMLGDHICQEQCNVESCGFDYGDCGCAPGCSLIYSNNQWIRLEENKGNNKCLVPSCFYNLLQDNLFLIKWVLLTQMHLQDMTITQPTQLLYGCSEDKLRKIDEGLETCTFKHECLNEEALWCFGLFKITDFCLRGKLFDCLVCSGVMIMGKCDYLLSSCPQGMKEYSSLSLLFSDSKVTWCLLDPALYHRSSLTTFYVNSTDSPKAEGTGTKSSPFKSLYYAFTQVYGIQTHIILTTGNHLYDRNMEVSYPLRKSALEPLNYDYGVTIQKMILEGESYLNPPIVYWKGSLSISSSAKEVYIKNIEFRGDKIIRDDCEGNIDLCYYCPYYDSVNNLNDKYQYVQNNFKKYYQENSCSQFKNDELFKFKGKVSIENVTFANFRQQFNTLIKIEGSLNLTKVSFSKIQPDVLGFVVEVSCYLQCKQQSFIMKDSLVEDLNYGNEERKNIESGSFLKLTGIHSALFTGNNFEFNFLFSADYSTNPSYFLKLENLLGTIIIENCKFEANLFNHIIEVDSTGVNYDSLDPDMYDISKSYSQTHFKMNNVIFDYIFLTGLVLNYRMVNFEQNINISNIFFNKIYSQYKQILKIGYEGKPIDYQGSIIEEDSRKIWKLPARTIFNDITIQNSYLNNSFIEVTNLGLVNISNVFFRVLFSCLQEPVTWIVKKRFGDAGKYLQTYTWTLYFPSYFGYCGQSIRTSKTYNLTVHNISIEDWKCYCDVYTNQGVHIEDSLGSVSISNLTGRYLESTSPNGLLLTIFNSQNIVKISNISVKFSFNFKSSMILVQDLKNLEFFNILIEKCQSIGSAVVEVKSIDIFQAGTLVFLENLVINGPASCLYIELNSISSHATLVNNSYFYRCKGSSATSSFAIETFSYFIYFLSLSDLKFDECYSSLSSIFKASTKLFIFSTPSMSRVEIINSIAKSAAVIELDNEGVFKIEKLFLNNNTASYAGIYVGSFSSKYIYIDDSAILNSVSGRSVICIREISEICEFRFNNLTISNMTFIDNSPIVFDATKSFINGSLLRAFDVGGLISADGASRIQIYDSFFYKMNETVVILTGKSNFSCFSCRFYENKNKLFKCSENSKIVLNSSVIFNNYFDEIGQNFIEINSGSALSKNILQNTSIFDNYIINGKFFTVLSSALVIQQSIFKNNQIDEAEFYGIELIDSDLTVVNSSFENQSSKYLAPFFNALLSSSIRIENSQFSSGISKDLAGALYLSSSSLIIESSTFLQNSAVSAGGCIYALNSYVSISNTGFKSNSAINATDLYFDSCNVFISSTTIQSFSKTFLNEFQYSIHFISSSVKISSSFFSQSTSGISSLYFRDCSQVTVQESVISNVHSVGFGSLTFIGRAKYGKVTLQNTSFVHNHCELSGGAIYMKNGFLDINNCLFLNNSATSGGAIYFEAPDCSECQLVIKNQSNFTENKATDDGGCVKWKNSKPIKDDSNIFINNSAIYGEILASGPAFMAISASSNETSSDFDLELTEVPPGQEYTEITVIWLKDSYNQTVTIDNESPLKIEPLFSSFSLRGQTSFQSASGTFNLTRFYAVGPPNSEQFFKATCESIPTVAVKNDETVYKRDLIFKVHLRGCVNGEQIGTDSCKVCEENKFLIIPEDKCKPCPEGGICPGGDKIYVKPGYYRSHYLSEILYLCDLKSACLGNQNDYKTICDKGYSGIKCGVCIKGYSKTKNFHCDKCPDHQSNILILFFITVLSLLVCGILVRITIKSAFSPKSKQSIYVKIFTNYLHFMFMISQFNFNWPDYAVKFFEIHKSASAITESVISIDCYISSQGYEEVYYLKLVFVACFPLVIFALSLLIWLGISFLSEIYTYMKREVFLTMIVVYFLMFPTIVKTTFSSYDCIKFDIIGEFLSADYSINCSTLTHQKYLKIISLPSILLWIIGFPLFILLLMIKRRKKLRQEQNKVIFGFLFNGYNLSIFYWEFIIMYRKVLIICIIVFLKQVSVSIQGNTLLALLLVSYLIQYKLSPYDSKELNLMEKDVLVAAIITAFCGLYFLSNDLDDYLKVFCFCFMILSNVKFLFLWLSG